VATRDISRIPIERVAHQHCKWSKSCVVAENCRPLGAGHHFDRHDGGWGWDRLSSACIMHHAREVWIDTRFGRLSKRQTNGLEKVLCPSWWCGVVLFLLFAPVVDVTIFSSWEAKILPSETLGFSALGGRQADMNILPGRLPVSPFALPPFAVMSGQTSCQLVCVFLAGWMV
jgi:hypothetical protein